MLLYNSTRGAPEHPVSDEIMTPRPTNSAEEPGVIIQSIAVAFISLSRNSTIIESSTYLLRTRSISSQFEASVHLVSA